MTDNLIIKTADPIVLRISAEDHELVLATSEQKLLMGVPSRGGDVNSAVNVGGQVEAFKDVIATILNFRTFQGISGVTITINGDVIEVSMDTSFHRGLDELVHDIAENSFTEYEYTGGRVDAIRIYTDAGKTKKIREEEFTYVANKATKIITRQYDGAGDLVETYTEDLNYTGNKITDLTGVLS